MDLVSQCVALLARVTMSNNGRVIKTAGDEIMFPDVENAALAASDVARSAGMTRTTHGLQARVGLHFGMVLDEGDDIFGDTVNTAARIARLCKADQILATSGCGRYLSSCAIPCVSMMRWNCAANRNGIRSTSYCGNSELTEAEPRPATH